MDVRAARLDLAARLDEVDAVIVMLFDAGGDREDIGVEDDVLGRKADAHQQVIGARADLDLAVLGVGLADLVERHDDHRRAIGHAAAG